MRVAFYTMSMCKGGTERVISEICNYGVAHGHEMHIITCLKESPEYELNRCVMLHVGFFSQSEYKLKSKLHTLAGLMNHYVKQVIDIDPDIVIAFLPEPCMITEICKYRVKKPIIGSLRSNPYYQYRSVVRHCLAELLYPLSDGFVFQTEGARRYFGKRLQRRSVVIGNPVRKLTPITYEACKQKQDIVSVGRFTEEKNYPLLIKAFYEVQKEKPEYELKIYGRVDERLGLRELCKSLGIDAKVHFCGQVDHVEDYIRDAALYVMSSKSEGMPNALMEAMALGLPVVATDCPSGGPRQLIRDGENGILVKNDDVSALATGMLRVLNDDSLADALAEKAKNIAQEYACDEICLKWLEYMQGIVEGR